MKYLLWISLLFASVAHSNPQQTQELRFKHGEAPRVGIPGGALNLTDHNGRKFSLQSNLSAKWTLVFFGFTRCTAICPTALLTARQVLSSEKVAPVRVLFVTLDPLSDQPADLAKYLKHFDARIVGLTGTPEQIEDAARRYGVATSGGGSALEHSGRWYLLSTDNRIVRTYRNNTPADALVQDLMPASL